MKLNFAPGLSVPLDFVTQTQAILAMRRRGKTYTASVQAEELLKAKQQIVAIDVTGAWWGLKSSSSGKSKGFDVVVAGGEHADIPLNPDAGELMAQAIVADRFSCILDLKLMRKGQRLQFLASFLEAFHSLNRRPVHVFADEADDYIPQTIIKSDEHAARCLGAMDDLVRRGGINGIGCTLITQRPAVINNNVLTQCEILTVLRLVHPADIAPVHKWVKVKATPDEEKRVMAELPTLPLGGAFFWAPGWPENKPIGVKRVQMRERETFNSSRTPKPGEKVQQPKVLAKVDIDQLGERIAAIAEQAKANDPKLLKKQNAALLKELEAARRSTPASANSGAGKTNVRQYEQTIARLRAGLETAMRMMKEMAEKKLDVDHSIDRAKVESIVRSATDGVVKLVNDAIQRGNADYAAMQRSVRVHVGKLQAMLDGAPTPVAPPANGKPETVTSRIAATPVPAGGALQSDEIEDIDQDAAGGDLPSGESKVLRAIASYEDGVDANQLSVLTAYKARTRNDYVLRLSNRGFVERQGDRIVVTAAGMAALGPNFKPLPTGVALQRYWLARLPAGEKKILEILIAASPDAVARESLDEPTNFKPRTRNDYLARMSARKIVTDAGRGMVKASDDLF